MEQKRTYQHCLLFGTSLLLAMASCTTDIDYRVRSKWIYINETNQPIELNVAINNQTSPDAIINPLDSLISSEDSEGPKEVTESTYVPPFGNDTVRYGQSQCLVYDPTGGAIGEGEGPFGTANYESRKIGERYYEFTYRFTEEEFAEAEDCE